MQRELTAFAWPGMALFAVALAGAAPAAAPIAPNSSAGPEDYRQYCAPCHGPRGRGDGPLVAHLGTAPADLTTLARRNEGAYPSARVFHAIEGRSPAKAHGAMPNWGEAFRASTDNGGEEGVRARIQAIVDHVASLQAKVSTGGEALALCVLTNTGLPGTCTEVAPLAEGMSEGNACGALLACLNDPGCAKAFCQATTTRRAWRLESSRRVILQP